MRKSIYLLPILFVLAIFSCSNNNDDEMDQDYTSFIVTNNSDIDLPSCVVGYKKNGLWIKVAELGNLNKGVSSKEVILDKFIEEDLYVFTDYLTPRRADFAFKLIKNLQNNFKFPENLKGVLVTDKKDPTQYPQ